MSLINPEPLRSPHTGNAKIKRKIVRIDEEKCDGCGQCVPSCAEGAIEIIDGKARLVSDRLCDGLGACLGECPVGAITIEERDSEAFDEAAVAARRMPMQRHMQPTSACPSAKILDFGAPPARPTMLGPTPTSTGGALRHWPVQLHLLPPTAPFLQDADLLISATCVPFAMPDFHTKLLEGRSLAIACPKLDDQTGYLEKLTSIFAHGNPKSVTVARMVVPCCGGLLRLVHKARELAGSRVPITDLIIGPDGRITETNTDAPVPERAACHGSL